MPEKTSYSPGEPIWVDLGTPDMDRTVAFYTELLGWTYGGGSPEHGGYGSFFLDGKQVAGVMPLMSPDMPPVWSCYVCTDDADKTTTLVTEAGGTVIAPPMDVGDLGRMAVYAAPDGAVIGIWQPGTHVGSELVAQEGAPSWIELATRDQATAVPFYASVFGWGTHENPGYTEFQVGGTSVAGCLDTPPTVPAEVPSYWMPYFHAESPAAQAEKAASLGGTVRVPETSMGGVTFAVVADPHGSSFGLLRMG